MADLIPSIDEPVTLPRTSIPRGDFSYEADIAPLQRRFFQQVESSPFLSEGEKSEQVFGLSDSLNKIVGERQKLRSQEQMMRVREMQYQSTMLAFETARSKAKEERDMLASLPEITSQLDSISNDPNMDRLQKKQALARWGIQHAGTLAKNPGAKVAFASAQDGVNAKGDDPLTFAANLKSLGINPNNPEVARMPGASPLAISLAKQAYEAEQTTLRVKKTADFAKQRNINLGKALDDFITKVSFQDPDDYDDGEADLNAFKDQKSRTVVDNLAQFANAEQRKLLENVKTDRERYDVVKQIYFELMRDRMMDPRSRPTNATLQAYGAGE